MSSSSSIQQARETLGKRLREIRKDAGLTARELASRAGWHESKCSRIENGRTPPSDDDLRVYTLHCAAADQTADLIATARNIEGAYVEWRRMERSGTASRPGIGYSTVGANPALPGVLVVAHTGTVSDTRVYQGPSHVDP